MLCRMPQAGTWVHMPAGLKHSIKARTPVVMLLVLLKWAFPNHGDDMAKPQRPADIDSYIALFPADVQVVLEKVRQTIKHAAPGAKETISYQMPAFKQNGILVYFAAWKHHIGLYPPVAGDKTLEKAVARYAGPKGNLQFPLDESIPYDLIERVVKLRVKDSVKAAAKRKKRK